MNKTTNSTQQKIAIALFAGLTIWWLLLVTLSQPEDFSRYVFGASYGLMALFGGIYGLVTAKKWGSFKSSFGRAIMFLAIGLLLAEFGQIVFSYYNIVKEELIPYPSIADIGFFGSIPLYIFGAFSLAKALNVPSNIMKNPLKLFIGIVIPLVLLGSSYMFFLKGYDATEVGTLTRLLDFGYPLGQAIYVSLALVIFLGVAKSLGGIMRKPLLFLLFAFIVQYVADFNFLYQNYHETWVNGGYGDYLYLVAYFAMTISLISLNIVFQSNAPVKQAQVIETPEVSNG